VIRHLAPAFAAALLVAAHARADERTDTAAIEQRLRTLLVSSPFKIPDTARAGTIRYHLRVLGEPWTFPETAEQHVRVDGTTTELTICGDCGRESAPTPDELRRYLAPNAWVQSKDWHVANFARAARGGGVGSTMKALVSAVRQRVDGAIVFR
jgi:hypothetical protein